MTAVHDNDTSLLRTEIPHQGEALRTAAAALPPAVAQVIAAAAERGATEWVVTGCGDSLFAGLCAEVWFAQLAGLRLQALHAMELSRYLHPVLGPRSVVIAVSHSGTTARVIEAAQIAHDAGALVVALTASSTSELAEIADITVDNSVQAERSNTRTSSFQAVALFMRMLADQLGGHQVGEHRTELAARVERYVGDAERQVKDLPDEVFAANHWITVGAGLGLAASEYGKAKLYEAATLPAYAVELEQFIHCEIFAVTAESVVVLCAPTGPGLSRARELAAGLAKLDARTIAVTNDDELAASCAFAVRLPADMAENDLPFFAAIPMQWMALRLAIARGENPDLVANKWVNRPLIDHSARWHPTDAATTQPEAGR